MTPETAVVDGPTTSTSAERVSEPISASSPGPNTTTTPRDPAGEATNLALLVGFFVALMGLGLFMSWWIPGLIAGLLGVLFLHELGHFVCARLSGMKVTEFFLGFGPRIWSFRRGETEYGIKAIPAGAYVRIIGMTNLDEVDPDEESRTYRAQPYWQRMVTICAGSAMHFAMAIMALVVLFASYGYAGFFGPPWRVDRVIAGSSAETIGIEAGDQITEFDGHTFNTWDDFGNIVLGSDVGPVEVQVERDGETVDLSGQLGARSGDILALGFGIVVEEIDAGQGWSVASTRDGSNAEDFGIEPNDLILAGGGVVLPSQGELAALLIDNDGGTLEILVRRAEFNSGSSELVLADTVMLDHTTPFRAFLGVGVDWFDLPEPSLTRAVGLAVDDFGTIARTNLIGLADLLNPAKLLSDDDAGPSTGVGPGGGVPVAPPDDEANRPVSIIGIFRMIAQSESVDEVLFLFTMVNVFIGLFNLAPLLPLDGGHAALATYERGRQLVSRDPTFRVDASRLIPLVWGVVILLVIVGLWAAVLDIFSWPA